MTTDTPEFRTSSFCCSGECVAVASIPGHVFVRHHRCGASATLEFNNTEWLVFLDGVRAGEFDDVIPATTRVP